jgi:hypothetical protein
MVMAVWPSPVSAEIISNFSESSEGWTVVDIDPTPLTNPPTITDTYGAASWSGLYIYTGDRTGNATYFSAPAKFLGDQSTAFGTPFSYDMFVAGSTAEASIDLLLVGSEMTLIGDLRTPSSSLVWETFEIPLVGTSFALNAVGGDPATDDNVRAVLTDLTGLYILADHVPGYEDTYLDNVRLQSIPEPSTIAALSSLGLCGLFALRWRRRRKS